ncbi:MAG: TetR/AcrR family transcriptional regulator [Clostridiales bacterium]|nr:TetR/AcrR family transcriptional regulator [Clostridiales bacterium]
MAGFTREIIMRTLIDLLNEKPLTKITVKDIVERCGVNRNTFYYHFRDIPDVVNAIMKREIDRIMEKRFDKWNNLADCLDFVFEEIRANQKDMLHIYRFVDRSIFADYLNRICESMLSEYISRKKQEKNVSEKDAEILVHYYKCTFVGILLDWLDNNMPENAEEDIRRFLQIGHTMIDIDGQSPDK